LSVSSLFLTRVGVYVCVSVCIRTHTHTLHRCSDVSPGVGMRHLEVPKNPDGLNLDIHIFVNVYKVHMCIYMLRGGMRSWTNCFFSLTLSPFGLQVNCPCAPTVPLFTLQLFLDFREKKSMNGPLILFVSTFHKNKSL